jgi:hypothetical protein
MMKPQIFLVCAAPILGLPVLAQTAKSAAASAQQPQPPTPTIASTVEREISAIEKQIVEAAEHAGRKIQLFS